MAQAQRWSDGVQLQDRSPRRSGRIDHQTSPRSLIDMRTFCCSYAPVYFCHIVTAADGCPCAVVIITVVIFLIRFDETRSVHFVLCLFMCILHFVSACHKKKKSDGHAGSAAGRAQVFRQDSI
jgi:hypothetical protein